MSKVTRWRHLGSMRDCMIPRSDGQYVAAADYDALEAALDDRRSPKAAAWKYLDDGVTLLRAALQAIPERYSDGEPSQLHAAIKEWLSRPDRAALAPKEPTALDRGGEHG